jgi:hypothetical protein
MHARRYYSCTLILLAIACSGPVYGQTESALDRPLGLLAQARESFRAVRDYECTMVSEERVRGELMPRNVMIMKCRTRPYGVYLRWQAPEAMKGQEVCYIAWKNSGRMRVHPVGLIGIVGFISIDLQDPRVLEKSRHPITEAGMGYLLESTARFWEMERRVNKTEVRIADYLFDGRPCIRIETIHPDRQAMTYYAYRCVMYLDKETHLPVRTEAYDWPRPGGPAGGDLLECYSYLKMRTNLGFSEKVFDH